MNSSIRIIESILRYMGAVCYALSVSHDIIFGLVENIGLMIRSMNRSLEILRTGKPSMMSQSIKEMINVE